MIPVYITSTGSYLPNAPVSNENMEEALGQVGGKPSRGKAIVLRNNGIRSRYYALNGNGSLTHNNAQLVISSIKAMFADGEIPQDIDVLSCGTSAPDQSLPSHTAMVHGLMDQELEIISPSGACCSGMHAMKYGFMSIGSGSANKAIASGSELVSPMMLARNFESESRTKDELDKNPYIAFEKDFLRWMLSDGAGSVLLSNEPGEGLNLKIEWIDSKSYANEFETCMYSAAHKNGTGKLHGWKELTPKVWLGHSVFAMKQDTKLLRENVVKLGTRFMKETTQRRGLDVSTIDHFLPHISSHFFLKPLLETFAAEGMEIPEEKVFMNLSKVGNIGSAAIYVMLDELIKSGELKKGQKILSIVPESARFSYAIALFTVC